MVWLTFRLKSVALHRTPRLFANFPVIVNSTIWAIQSAAVNMLIYFVNDRFVTGSLVCLRGPELFRVVNLPEVVDAGIALRGGPRWDHARNNCAQNQNARATNNRKGDCQSPEASSIFRHFCHIY